MPVEVSDFRSNANDQIAFAARTIGRSRRRRVFEGIYRGKRSVKTVRELAIATGLSRKQVLTAGLALVKTHLVEQTVHQGDTAYRKDPTYSHYRDQILKLADNPDRLRRLPTKTSPLGSVETHVSVNYPRQFVKVQAVTIDDIESFGDVRDVNPGARILLPEAVFKAGVQSIIGETGTFTDWGGEGNDLFTTRVRYRGSRIATAFAFKGPGLRGRLTPARLGKNGDQLQRLFMAPAALLLIQYWGQVDQQIYDDMRTFAVAKSVAQGSLVMYGVIDGSDTSRMVAAYPDHFRGTLAEESQ